MLISAAAAAEEDTHLLLFNLLCGAKTPRVTVKIIIASQMFTVYVVVLPEVQKLPERTKLLAAVALITT